MAYQEKTTTNYGQRLSGSFKGIATGFLMFIAGTALLFWNEGNFVKAKKAINEAQSAVVTVNDVSTLDSELNGKLIHGVSKALTNDTLHDELFDVSVNAIKLSRKVEYYQWTESTKSEKRDKIGGGQETVTSYTYKTEWVNNPINSSDFRDPQYQSSNTTITTVENKNQVAENVTWGAYELPLFLKNAISGNIPAGIELSEQSKAEWEKVLQPSIIIAQDSAQAKKEYLHVSGNTIYLGANPASPAVGDMRTSFTYTPPGGDLSIIAQVQGNSLTQYISKNGREFSSVQNGVVSAEQMFNSKHKSNSMWTWILRLAGLLLIISGLKSMFSILPSLFKVLPFLGNIVEAGVGLVCSILGFVWSLLIISIAWLFFRPVIGISLLLIVGGGIWYLKKKAKEKQAIQI